MKLKDLRLGLNTILEKAKEEKKAPETPSATDRNDFDKDVKEDPKPAQQQAGDLGIHKSTLSRYGSKDPQIHRDPSMDVYRKIAKKMGMQTARKLLSPTSAQAPRKED